MAISKKILLNLSGLNCEKKSPQEKSPLPFDRIMIVSFLYPSHNIVQGKKALFLLDHLHPQNCKTNSFKLK
jgi:hypothetical protein